MDKLWAPWRTAYFSVLNKKQKKCVFCRISKSKEDRKNLVFIRARHSFAVLNLYPYNNGHTLVMPYRHVGEWERLTAEEQMDLMGLLSQTQRRLKAVLHPQGFNVGINIGRAAGAGFPGHLHIHVVPRWSGDVNFMPVLTDTKVISQSLDELCHLLVSAKKRA